MSLGSGTRREKPIAFSFWWASNGVNFRCFLGISLALKIDSASSPSPCTDRGGAGWDSALAGAFRVAPGDTWIGDFTRWHHSSFWQGTIVRLSERIHDLLRIPAQR